MNRPLRTLFATVLIAACARASSSRSASAPLATSANPCSVAGVCSITVKIPREAAEELHGVMSFRVYAGCPRTLGFRADGGSPYSAGNSAPVSETIKRNTTLRAAKPIAATPETTIVIPSMKGARATVAIFYGADPGKYAVVDFSDDPNQEARFGYVFRGSTMFDDLVTDSQNRTTERRICS